MRKVLLVDDHNMVAEGLKYYINNAGGYEVIDLAINGEDALVKAKELKPDVILLDYQLPDCEGIDLIPKFLQNDPELKIIMITSFEDANLVMKAVNAGARGYLTKNINEDELKYVLDGVFKNDKVWIDPNITYQFVKSVSCEINKARDPFTEDEKQLINFLAEGKTNKQIAESLYVTNQTVKHYLTKIYRKIGIRNRAEAASYAIKNNIICN